MRELNRLSIIVERETGKNKQELVNQNRKVDAVFARMIFVYLSRQAGFSYPTIGAYLKRDHTSIIHLYQKAKENPEIERIYNKYNAKGLISTAKVMFLKTKGYQKIYELYGAKCFVCSFDEVVEIHHIIPRYLGGGDEITNLILLCPNHHSLVDKGLIKIKDINIPEVNEK